MVKRLLTAAMGIAVSMGAAAQEKARRVECGLEYSTELQTDFKRAKWVNLLRADLSVGLVYSRAAESRDAERKPILSLSAATLSTAQTDERPLMDDLQGFSNIEAENMPLTLAVLSLDWETERTSLSVGVRNLNERYFATDLTSFFTQSSHGIFPTIAANFPIANYPVASLGLDFQWRVGQFALDASVYNGVGGKDFTGRASMFRLCPRGDGLFGAVQLSHEAGYGNSHIGLALRGDRERTRAALWTYTEVRLTRSTQLLAQYSVAPGRDVQCSHYAGLGLRQSIGRVEVGLAESFARFAPTDEEETAGRVNEWATELTASLPVTRHAALQPVVHICRTGGRTDCVGLLRLSCVF